MFINIKHLSIADILVCEDPLLSDTIDGTLYIGALHIVVVRKKSHGEQKNDDCNNNHHLNHSESRVGIFGSWNVGNWRERHL